MTSTPEPTATPRPEFPHKIVDGKIVFDRDADQSQFEDLTKDGELTKEKISAWLNSPLPSGMVTSMPSADSVCPVNWSQVLTFAEEQVTQVAGFVTSEHCAKDNAPVRVLRAAVGDKNFQDKDGKWWTLPVMIFDMQVFTPEHPLCKRIPGHPNPRAGHS